MKLAFALLLASSSALARPAQTGGYAVELVDAGGSPLATYHHRGDVYVLGTYGQRYNVRVTNRTGERVEAVITVDGRDAISGDHGSFRQRGYVLDPYGSVTVEGFRQNLSAVAAFRFTAPGDSYAGRRGSVRNNGVIGVAIFQERVRTWHRPQPLAREPWYGMEDQDANEEGPVAGAAPVLGDLAAADSATKAPPRTEVESRAEPERKKGIKGYGGGGRAAPPRQNLGTQYGESVYSSVVEVPFERRSQRPSVVLSLYYDDYDGLRSKGVIQDPPYYGGPDPFPAHRRFAPPPN